MKTVNPELLMMRGLLLEATQEQRDQALGLCESIKTMVKEAGDLGAFALAMAALELEDEGKK